MNGEYDSNAILLPAGRFAAIHARAV